MLNLLKKKININKDFISEEKFPLFISEFYKFLLEEGKSFHFKEKEQKEKEKKQFKNKLSNIFLKKILTENIVNKNNIGKIELKHIFISTTKELNEILKNFIEDNKERINNLKENDNNILESILIESFFKNEKIKNISEENLEKTFIINLINSLYYAKQCECIDIIQSKLNDLSHILPNIFISIELLCKILNYEISLKTKNEKVIFLTIKLNESLIILSQELYENAEMTLLNYIFEQNLLKTFVIEASKIQKLRIYIYEFFIRYIFINKDGGQKINNLSNYLEENECFETLLTSITLSFLNKTYSNIFELFNEIFLFLITYIFYKKGKNFSDYSKDKLITLIHFIFESEMKKDNYEDILIPFINKLLIIDYVSKEELRSLDIFKKTESELLKNINLENFKNTYIINLLLYFINSKLDFDFSLKSKKVILSCILKDLNTEKYKKILQETDFYKIVIEKLYYYPEEIIIRVFNFLLFQYDLPERDSNLSDNKKEKNIKNEIKSIILNIDKINDENILKIILKQFQQFISLNSSFQNTLCFDGVIFMKLKDILNNILNKFYKINDLNNKNGNYLLTSENIIQKKQLESEGFNNSFLIKKRQSYIKEDNKDIYYSCKMIEELLNFIELLILNNEDNFNLLSETGILNSSFFFKFSQGNILSENNYKNISYKLWCLEMIYDNSNYNISNQNNIQIKNKDKAISSIKQNYLKIKENIQNIIKNENNILNSNYENDIKHYLNEINLMNESIGIKFYKEKEYLLKNEKALFNDIIFDFPNLLFEIVKNKNKIINTQLNINEKKNTFEKFIHNIIKGYIIILLNIIQNLNLKVFKVFTEDISSKIYVPFNKNEFKEIFFNVLNIYLLNDNEIKKYFHDIQLFIIENSINKKDLSITSSKYLKLYSQNNINFNEDNINENDNSLELSKYYLKKYNITNEILEENNKKYSNIFIYNPQILIMLLKFLIKNKLFIEIKEYLLFLNLIIKINENNCYVLISQGLINSLIKLCFIILETEEEKSEIFNLIYDIFISTIPNLEHSDIEILLNYLFISIRYSSQNEIINKLKIDNFLKVFQNFNIQLNNSRKIKRNIIFSNLNSRQPNIYNILFSSGIYFNISSKELEKKEKENSNNLCIYISTRFYNIDDSNFILFKLEKNLKEKDKNPIIFSINIEKKELKVKDCEEKLIGKSKDISNEIIKGKNCNFLIIINTEINKIQIFLKHTLIFNEISNFKNLNLFDSEISYNIILGYPGTSIRDVESNLYRNLSYIELSYLLIYLDNIENDFKETFSLSNISSSKNGSINSSNIPIEYLNYKSYKAFVPSDIGQKPDLLKVNLKINKFKVVYELIVDKLNIISKQTLKKYTSDNYFVNNFINRMQRNYYMDVLEKKFIVYVPNTNYKVVEQEYSYNKHTFLLSKTKYCDSILLNQIYNQENLYEDILSKNILINKTLDYTLKGFNFIEIILMCLNECIIIKDEENKKKIIYILLKTLSLYLIHHLSLLNNFSKTENFKILIYILVKNGKFLSEKCLEIFFLLSYALKEKTNIQLLDPWYPEIITNLLLDIHLFKESSYENKKYIIEKLREVIAPTMSNEINYDFKIIIIEKLYHILLMGNNPLEIDSLIANILMYIIEQCLKTKKGFKQPSENQLNKIIKLSSDYLILTDCFSNKISEKLSKRNFNNKELEETTNLVKVIFSKLYSDDIKPIRSIISTFFPKLNDDFQTLFMINTNEENSNFSRRTANAFYTEQANKMQILLSKIIDYNNISIDDDNSSLDNYLESKIKYEIKFMKYILSYKQFMKNFFYYLYLKYRHINFISKYISEECEIKYSWYVYNREGLSRIRNKLILKCDNFSDEKMSKSYKEMLNEVNKRKNDNESLKKIHLNQSKNLIDFGLVKINNIIKNEIWLDQIFHQHIINELIDEDDIIDSYYNCLLFKGLNYYTCIFILGEKKIYIIKNFHIDKNGIIYMNNGNINNSSHTDCFKKYFWAIKNYENELKEHCNYLNIKSLEKEEDEFYISSKEEFSLKRSQLKIYKFEYLKINEIHKRKFLHQENSIEIFLTNGKNYMLSFNIDKREIIFTSIIQNIQSLENIKKNMNNKLISNSNIINNKIYCYLRKSKIFIKKNKIKSEKEKEKKKLLERKTILDKSIENWSNGIISNYDYIMILNTLSGRTYNDLSQYPIYPWIISDYKSERINLYNNDIYRDLKFPIFAQEEENRKKLKLKFEEVENGDEKYFSGTHY